MPIFANLEMMQMVLSQFSGRSRLAAIAIAFAFAMIAAQANAQQTVLLPPIEETVHDIERPEPLISASRWLRGLYLSTVSAGERPRLVGIMPASWAGTTICVRAVTNDGRYEFSAEYAVTADATARRTELGYPTAFASAWSNATASDSGVTIGAGSCSGGRPDDAQIFIPARWNGDEQSLEDGNRKLVVNLHGRSAQEVVATATMGTNALDLTCSKVSVTDASQFNFTCTILVQADAEGTMVFEYRRLSDGRVSEPRQAIFYLATTE